MIFLGKPIILKSIQYYSCTNFTSNKYLLNFGLNLKTKHLKQRFQTAVIAYCNSYRERILQNGRLLFLCKYLVHAISFYTLQKKKWNYGNDIDKIVSRICIFVYHFTRTIVIFYIYFSCVVHSRDLHVCVVVSVSFSNFVSNNPRFGPCLFNFLISLPMIKPYLLSVSNHQSYATFCRFCLFHWF